VDKFMRYRRAVGRTDHEWAGAHGVDEQRSQGTCTTEAFGERTSKFHGDPAGGGVEADDADGPRVTEQAGAACLGDCLLGTPGT
jgi:hypothetical protein